VGNQTCKSSMLGDQGKQVVTVTFFHMYATPSAFDAFPSTTPV
jgi:hypothetical protein